MPPVDDVHANGLARGHQFRVEECQHAQAVNNTWHDREGLVVLVGVDVPDELGFGSLAAEEQAFGLLFWNAHTSCVQS